MTTSPKLLHRTYRPVWCRPTDPHLFEFFRAAEDGLGSARKWGIRPRRLSLVEARLLAARQAVEAEEFRRLAGVAPPENFPEPFGPLPRHPRLRSLYAKFWYYADQHCGALHDLLAVPSARRRSIQPDWSAAAHWRSLARAVRYVEADDGGVRSLRLPAAPTIRDVELKNLVSGARTGGCAEEEGWYRPRVRVMRL